MNSRRSLGRSGELRAVRRLEALGWHILERGWRCRLGEIDLIGLDGETLVFVEVKSRSTDRCGGPEEAVDRRKRSRLVRAALSYLESEEHGERAVRFDVVAWDRGEFRHTRDAFSAEGYTR